MKVDIIKGVEGYALYFDGVRVAGPKPWGGGDFVASFEVERGEGMKTKGGEGDE